jgi:hypothetical protein
MPTAAVEADGEYKSGVESDCGKVGRGEH